MSVLDKIDHIFDRGSRKLSRQRDLKRFKKLAKEYEFPKTFMDQFYKSFQKLKDRVVYTGNKREKLSDSSNFSEVKFVTLFLLRAYQLTNEFLHTTTYQLTHSSIALTRGMYELFLTTIYAKNNPEIMDVITSEKEGKIPGMQGMVDKLKKEKVKFFVSQMDEDEKISKKNIIPELNKDYIYFSGLVHSHKKETYYSNLTHSLDTGKDEAIILGNWYLQYHEKKEIISKFISYTIVLVRELEKMDSKVYVGRK